MSEPMPRRRRTDDRDIIVQVLRADKVLKALVALLIALVITTVGFIAAVSWTTSQRVIAVQQENTRTTQEVRERNEEHHACIVELIFAVVDAADSDDNIGDVEDPCPPDLDLPGSE